MKRLMPKLTSVLVVLLCCAVALATASSQEKQNGFDLDALAAKGEAIANADPLSAELRNRQPDGSGRRGFDIGMAVAEGHTAPGPGKDRIGASLSRAEQGGFRTAVSFSLERNRNADFAVSGAAIAKVDERVAAARTAEADVFYWLGFDIATGIFGDPALGAKGNTAIGPGSLKIRDSLSAAGQRGFNAALKLHLGQSPPPSAPEGRPRTPGAAVDLNSPYTQETGKNSTGAAAVILTLQRVPNVVGLSYLDAARALRQAGFEPKTTFLDEPDPSVLYGNVRATIPAAGKLAADGKVELQIPRAASRLGIGALSVSDLERRAGFDLDEGRYEEILRGADIVLRKYENEPRIDPSNGSTYYAGGGVYIEPSDGAVLASLNDVRSISQYGLGSYLYYGECERALKQKRVARVEISRPNDGLATICVLTAKQQIVVVEFRNSDNPYNQVSNYKFHLAIFPRQLVRLTDSIRVRENSPHWLTPKKPE